MEQKTLQNAVALDGIGVHAGVACRVTLVPAREGSGIVFINAASPKQRIRVGDVVPEPAMHATVLRGEGWAVSTVEHLMAAVWVAGVTNLEILVEGPEIPILDGSSLLFCQALKEGGVVRQGGFARFVTPAQIIQLHDEKGRSLVLEPATDGLTIAYAAGFKHPLAGVDRLHTRVTPEIFEHDVAPARTFGFLEQLPHLRQHKLARGTSLGNSVVIGDYLMNEMRLAGECVRHKVLDLIGDMSLLGVGLQARVRADRTSHDFNRLLIKHFKENPTQWLPVEA